MTLTVPQNAAKRTASAWISTLREAGLALTASMTLLAVIYVATFHWTYPEFRSFMNRDASKLIARGKDLIPVSVSKFRVENSSAVIEEFNGDEAILALSREFVAEDYPFIQFTVLGLERRIKAKILWQQVGKGRVYSVGFEHNGKEQTQIAMPANGTGYEGRIASIAILLYTKSGETYQPKGNTGIKIEQIQLKPFTLSSLVRQVIQDITRFDFWKGSSHNQYLGAGNHALLIPGVALHAFLILTLIVIVIRHNGRHDTERSR